MVPAKVRAAVTGGLGAVSPPMPNCLVIAEDISAGELVTG